MALLLEKLAELGGTDQALPEMYQMTPVRWIVDLNLEGKFLGMVPLVDESAKGKRANRGKPMCVPHIMRSSGVRAKLLADNGEYVFGRRSGGDNTSPAADEGDEADDSKLEERFDRFWELVYKCAEATGVPDVAAVSKFKDQIPEIPIPDTFYPKDTVTFRVNGVVPVDLPEVQRFWAHYVCGLSDTPIMECLVCGRHRPAQERFQIKIKGIPGGQSSGMALVSANMKSFNSYGRKSSLNSPVCAECAERIGNVLNGLTCGEKTHLAVGKMVYVFWTKGNLQFSPVSLLENPTPEEIQRLLRSPAIGRGYEVDDQAFYAAALSASGGRVVVRSWVESTVAQVKQNLNVWFSRLAIVSGDGEPAGPMGVFSLASSLYREARDMTSVVPVQLITSALEGRPLPWELLRKAVVRCRIERRVDQRRAALIKAVLTAQALEGADDLESEQMLESLQENFPDSAYQFGRLVAVLEAIQREAVPGAKGTLVDRYFGAASSAPWRVYATLMRNAQAHLGKLRRDPQKGSAYHALQQRLEDIQSHIAPGGLRRVLSIEEQGLFMLGYYHQRAEDRRQARLRSAQKTHNDEEKRGNQQ